MSSIRELKKKTIGEIKVTRNYNAKITESKTTKGVNAFISNLFKKLKKTKNKYYKKALLSFFDRREITSRKDVDTQKKEENKTLAPHSKTDTFLGTPLNRIRIAYELFLLREREGRAKIIIMC